MTASNRFAGRRAIVTGGASGIGAATSRRMAAEGASVMIADLNGDLAAELASELGASCASHTLDVSDEQQVAGLIAATVERFGGLDIVINNAGIGGGGRTPEIEGEAWRHVIAVDLHSVFYACKHALPHMVAAGGGAIVNTASISGRFADYGFGPYNAAKAAVINYTRTLAIDHAHEGVRVNSVSPGPIETPLASAILTPPRLRQDYAHRLPMARPGRSEEVAAAICFLASDDASYVTGHDLVVDGGLTAHTGQPRFTDYAEDIAASLEEA